MAGFFNLIEAKKALIAGDKTSPGNILRSSGTNGESKLLTAVRPSSSSSDPSRPPGLTDHKVNNFERWLLVYFKKFPSKDQVPAYVPQNMMERTRNRARIRLMFIGCILTMVGAGIMIYSGRKAAHRGESMVQMNIDWHKKYNEEAERKKKE